MTDPHAPTFSPRWAVLALGLAATVTIWALAYAALLQPGLILGDVVFGLMVIALVAWGYIAGRFGGLSLGGGAGVGLVSAGFNLLIIGSLIGDAGEEGFATRAIIWGGGTLAGSAILTAIGAMIGRVGSRPLRRTDINWYGLFTKMVAAAAFLLLLSGGIVTGYEAGLAVPDWPGSFGHNMILYPLTQMTSDDARVAGVHYEHAHRLYGMLVGLSTMTLAGTVWFADRPRRNWLGLLCVAALVMVSVQGYLGGTRVTETSIALAIVHGVFAQIVFATLVAIAAFTSAAWRLRDPAVAHPSASTERSLSIALLAMFLLQLGLGASYRHLSTEPDLNQGMVTGILHTHVVFAVVLLVAIILIGIRASTLFRAQPTVKRTGKAMMHTVGLQILLGIFAFIAVLSRNPGEAIPAWEVVTTTLHQAIGALLFALATLYATWTRRLLVSEP